jgi:glutamyl-tRNA synthetase
MTSEIRTRFAPSPTGYLHLGGARSALFSWAFARHFGGVFVLRIEDTDVERSTPEAVAAILKAMDWLGLDYDEGPFYQMQHLARYNAVIGEMLSRGSAYHCYTSPEELEVMREEQRQRGEKPRYDGRWRPIAGKVLPPVPAGVKPVVRFANPREGAVSWHDLVKGPITISNDELDDLIIARSDGTPTYNFCVCVDDWDMGITHVIRGDDHINNTPRQINILAALGAKLPEYGHLPLILGPDGQKLSKRNGTVSVMQYELDGFLPDALINYLARLGWSHGDSEIFSREEMIKWFDIGHVSKSAAQWDPKKLAWLNQHYIKAMPDERLAELIAPRLAPNGVNLDDGPSLPAVIALVKDRAETLVQLADAITMFFRPVQPDPEMVLAHVSEAVYPALAAFVAQSVDIQWQRAEISALIKALLGRFSLKMPQLAVALRVFCVGQPQTPSIDAVLELVGRDRCVARIEAGLALFAGKD